MSTATFASIRLKGEYDAVYQYVFDFMLGHWPHAIGLCRYSEDERTVVAKGERVRGCQVFDIYKCEDDYLLRTLFGNDSPMITAKVTNNFLMLSGNCPEVSQLVTQFQAHPLWS